MSIGAILLIIVVLMLLGVLPIWSHSSHWSYRPTGGMSVLVVVVLVLVIMGIV